MIEIEINVVATGKTIICEGNINKFYMAISRQPLFSGGKPLAPSSKWKISEAVRDVLQKQKGWMKNQSPSENEPCNAAASKNLDSKSSINFPLALIWIQFGPIVVALVFRLATK